MPPDQPLTVAPSPHIREMANVGLYELLTVDEVAAILRVSKSWVYEHTRSRGTPRSDQLPHVKIGKYVRFDPRVVREFLDRRSKRL